jgi:tetratricopeptide (TPR) repeat protein
MAKAWLLATSTDDSHRDDKQAIEAATKVCELTFWKDDDALDHLAAAYAESGDFAKAVQWQTKALEFAPPAKRPMLELRLDMYSDGKPYRESILD